MNRYCKVNRRIALLGTACAFVCVIATVVSVRILLNERAARSSLIRSEIRLGDPVVVYRDADGLVLTVGPMPWNETGIELSGGKVGVVSVDPGKGLDSFREASELRLIVSAGLWSRHDIAAIVAALKTSAVESGRVRMGILNVTSDASLRWYPVDGIEWRQTPRYLVMRATDVVYEGSGPLESSALDEIISEGIRGQR